MILFCCSSLRFVRPSISQRFHIVGHAISERASFGSIHSVVDSRAHGVVVSHPLSMREALGSIPSVSMLRDTPRPRQPGPSTSNSRHRSRNQRKPITTPAIAQLVEHLTVDACSNQMVLVLLPCRPRCRIARRHGAWASAPAPRATGDANAASSSAPADPRCPSTTARGGAR